ncbi:MAG: LCP family protein [bacterium]
MREFALKLSQKFRLKKKSTNSKLTIIEEKPQIKVSKKKIKLPKRLKVKHHSFKIPVAKLFFLFLILGIFALLAFGYYRIKQISTRVENFNSKGEKVACTNIMNPECWTDAFKPQLKQTNGFTNALIVGIDSRSDGWSGSGLMNTDTIMMLSFNHANQKLTMISIPRDFYVDEYGSKINAVYAYTYKKDPSDPYRYLKEMVTKITGQPVHYLITIKLEGVIEGIDAIGGIEICPKDAVTAKYPNDYRKPGDPGWLRFEYTKGCQVVDGQRGLVYARFRYMYHGPDYYGSDYSRARRQQEVLTAIKTKLLSEDMTLSERAEKYSELITTYNKNVRFDFSFEDILAGLTFIDTADRDPVNLILDPYFGGGLYSYVVSVPGYNIKAKDTSYKSIQAEINRVQTYPDFFRETPKIMIRNLSGVPFTGDSLAEKLKNEAKYSKGIFIESGDINPALAGIHIYDFSGATKPKSLDYLQKFFGETAVIETVDPATLGLSRSAKGEDILVVIGLEEVAAPSVNPSN